MSESVKIKRKLDIKPHLNEIVRLPIFSIFPLLLNKNLSISVPLCYLTVYQNTDFSELIVRVSTKPKKFNSQTDGYLEDSIELPEKKELNVSDLGPYFDNLLEIFALLASLFFIHSNWADSLTKLKIDEKRFTDYNTLSLGFTYETFNFKTCLASQNRLNSNEMFQYVYLKRMKTIHKDFIDFITQQYRGIPHNEICIAKVCQYIPYISLGAHIQGEISESHTKKENLYSPIPLLFIAIVPLDDENITIHVSMSDENPELKYFTLESPYKMFTLTDLNSVYGILNSVYKSDFFRKRWEQEYTKINQWPELIKYNQMTDQRIDKLPLLRRTYLSFFHKSLQNSLIRE